MALPRYATARSDLPTTGRAVAKVAAALGRPLMPWQRLVADVAGETLPSGRPRHKLILVTVQRQGGKSTLVRPVVLHRMFTMHRARVWLTAQTRGDARDHWEDLVEDIEDSPLSRVCKIRRSNGSESVRVPRTGSRLRIFAPRKRALHGKATDFVGVDEGWAFTAEQGEVLMQAIAPTQITRPTAQTWVYSAAGDHESTWLRSLVTKAMDAMDAGEDPGFAFFDWGIPDDADPCDLDVIAAHHPAFGHTIDMEGLRAARVELSDDAEFARAYGNRWTAARTYLIAPPLWSSRAAAAAAAGPVALAVEISLDRETAVIMSAGGAVTGVDVLELVDVRAGVSGLSKRIRELAAAHQVRAVVIDPVGPARPIAEELAKARRRLPLVLPSGAELVQAWNELVDALADGSLVYRPHPALDAAAAAAGSRRVKEQTVISREGPVAPLVAAMLALYGWRHPPDLGQRPAVVSQSATDGN